MGPTVTRLVQDPLAVLNLNNRLYLGNDTTASLKLLVRTMLPDDCLQWLGNDLKVCPHFCVLLYVQSLKLLLTGLVHNKWERHVHLISLFFFFFSWNSMKRKKVFVHCWKRCISQYKSQIAFTERLLYYLFPFNTTKVLYKSMPISCNTEK